MKQLNFSTFLVSLVVMGVMSSCSSTKYGAHFQPSKYQPHAYDQEERSNEEAPLVEENSELSNLVAEGADSETNEAEMASPVASVEKVPVAKEVPVVEDVKVRQEEIAREVKERLENMTRKEKRDLRRQVRKLNLSEYTKNLPAYSNLEVEDLQQDAGVNIIALIFALLLPPLGVFLHQGEINNKFWISLLLTVLFYVPGQIYSVLVVLGVID